MEKALKVALQAVIQKKTRVFVIEAKHEGQWRIRYNREEEFASDSTLEGYPLDVAYKELYKLVSEAYKERCKLASEDLEHSNKHAGDVFVDMNGITYKIFLYGNPDPGPPYLMRGAIYESKKSNKQQHQTA